MVYSPVLPPWRSPPVSPIVLLLHAPSQAAVACELVRVWQPSIPVADIFTVSVIEGEERTDSGTVLRIKPDELVRLARRFC